MLRTRTLENIADKVDASTADITHAKSTITSAEVSQRVTKDTVGDTFENANKVIEEAFDKASSVATLPAYAVPEQVQAVAKAINSALHSNNSNERFAAQTICFDAKLFG